MERLQGKHTCALYVCLCDYVDLKSSVLTVELVFYVCCDMYRL